MLYTYKHISCSLLFLLTALSCSSASPLNNLLLPSDAVYLLAFKTKADVDNKLHYNLNEHFDYCQWQGVKCAHGRVVRFGLQSLSLRGTFQPDTLSRLDQLRILILRNNSLSGPVPDLSGLKYLKTLFLDRNFFSGSFPPSLLFLHQLLNLDLAHNNFTGLIPVQINRLDRVVSLRLESNRFNGPIPPLNQTTLTIFNVSDNNFTGPVPFTSTLKKFTLSSFKSNPNLCGDVVNKPCSSPFFGSPPESASGGGGAAPPTPLLQNARSQGEENDLAQTPHKRRNKIGIVLGLLIALLILIATILSIFAIVKRRGMELESKKINQSSLVSESLTDSPERYTNPSSLAKAVEKISVQSIELPPQHPSQPPRQPREVVVKSGDLRFCSGEAEVYSLEQLMRGSAELLGRGTLGTTYKAVMDSQLIVCVKRLDATKAEGTSGEAFESHLEAVGVLRHPNLVPVRAYFQAKQERLIIYDYQPNGSLFNLIHGSRSTRAKPLHWTSCLKLAEDVAQGLVYIHQASGLVHGNLKSSNVLLGSDFEACLTDYCVSILANLSPNDDDPDSAGYKAPEVLKSSNRCTAKSDVYAFGVLLLELLSGKPPSHHPFLAPPDVADWVRVMRDDNSEEDKPLGLLVDVATICSLRSPEQRPTMRQVLKMIQDIKESAMIDSGSDDPYGGYS